MYDTYKKANQNTKPKHNNNPKNRKTPPFSTLGSLPLLYELQCDEVFA